ncbi:MAG: hypothetical protein H7840_01870 [Alphaproteobacteria bacterium]
MSVPLRIIAVLAASWAVGGCSLRPFVDEPVTGTEKVLKPKQREEDRVYVCYNAAYATPEEVTDLARQECARTGKEARLLGQTYWQCRLFIPTRAHFECVSSAQAPEPEPGPELEPEPAPERLPFPDHLSSRSGPCRRGIESC